MRRFTFVYMFVITGFFSAFVSVAQTDSQIEYGQIVTGEITNRDFEIPFDFTGQEGDVVIVKMDPVEALGDLNNPEIILLDSEGDVVADTSGGFSFGHALLAIQLSHEGTYTILATRRDGRSGDSVGEFTLELVNPQMLTTSESISQTISSEEGDQYYIVETVTPSLFLAYQKVSGDFSPAITINRINDDFGLTSVITLSGDELETGKFAVPSNSDFYIVAVGEATFDFNFREVEAEYTLELSSEE